ncbi:MAG: hypothetical protein LBM77_01045 [Spirochaetaceae bacterium]|jgi:hypothetical protein|nr:hypothetical protein [Spirochaetaceae bacterium]
MTNNQIPGCCPFWTGGSCCLSGESQSSGQEESQCKNQSNCKTCGNYEAWERGSNYTYWVIG